MWYSVAILGCFSSGTKKPVRTERIAGGIVFWIVFLIAVVQALNILSLHEAAEPIRNVLGKIIGYLPNLLAAGVLALIAWGVAAALRYAALVLMHALHVDERIERSVDTGGKECNLSFTVATALFWLVILAFVPAVLGALEITGLESPFERVGADLFRRTGNDDGAGRIESRESVRPNLPDRRSVKVQAQVRDVVESIIADGGHIAGYGETRQGGLFESVVSDRNQVGHFLE